MAHLPTDQLSISVGSKHIKAKICNSHDSDIESGLLMCEYDVVNKKGDAVLQPRDIDSKDDQVGKRLNFTVEITGIQGLP